MVNRRERGFTRLATTLIGILGVIVLAGGLVFGQNFSAAISGFVRDTTGAVVPGTTVTAKQTGTGLTRTVQTSEEGGYTMPSLPVGSYEVTAEKPGFRQQVRRGITLEPTGRDGIVYPPSSLEGGYTMPSLPVGSYEVTASC